MSDPELLTLADLIEFSRESLGCDGLTDEQIAQLIAHFGWTHLANSARHKSGGGLNLPPANRT